MFVNELSTADPSTRLVKPDVERDAPLSVGWLSGAAGRETLRLMGESQANNHESTIEAERERIAEFLARKDALDWMIEHEGKVVGAIWVDLGGNDEIPAPDISLMIGDSAARGLGIGRNALQAVIDWLFQERGNEIIYARHLTENYASAGLLGRLGFHNVGDSYFDKDGLHWQNVSLTKQPPNDR